jgi:hypothetical protein
MLLDEFWRDCWLSGRRFAAHRCATLMNSPGSLNHANSKILRIPPWRRQSNHLRGASVRPVSHELVGKINHKEEETE